MPHLLDLRLLGPVHVEVDGVPVRGFASRKTLALLCYVALAERPVQRTQLATLFWGDKQPAQARANLSWSLHALQSVVPDVLVADRETVAWKRHPDHRLDVAALHAILQRGDLRALAEGVSLYRGCLLEGLELNGCPEWELWLQGERERWMQRVIQALHTLVAHHLQTRAYADGLACVGRLLGLDPLDETAHRQRMLLLHGSGQRTAALAHYDAYRHLLDQELGVEPGVELTALDDALRAPSEQPTRVPPPQLRPLIGREAEIQALVQRLLEPATRLVCITGPGGVGKTTLALHVAAQVGPGLANGAVIVMLAAIASAELLPTALAAALQFVPTSSSDPWVQVLNHLSTQEMLLVLDNWEHLLDASGQLAELMLCAPGLRLLVTSREQLNLQRTEHVALEGLAVEEQSDGNVLPSAARLFVQRAQRTLPSFELAPSILPDVMEICRLVDGLPLAIELASAWIRTLSPADIVQEIRSSLDLLDQGFHDLPERHRGIRAVVGHSWQLLSTQEQTVMRRLAVFRGDFDAAAATMIAVAPGGMLITLVSKSLVRSAGARYLLHPLIQQYADEQSRMRRDEHDAVQDRHADYYARLLHSQESRLNGDSDLEALRLIQADIDNIRAAWQWAAINGRWRTINQALHGLYSFFNIRAQYAEGIKTLGQVASMLECLDSLDAAQSALLGRALARQGSFYYHRDIDDGGRARSLLEQSIRLLYAAPAERTLPLMYLADLLRVRCEHAEATRLFEAARAIYEEIGDRGGVAKICLRLGTIAIWQGAYSEGRRQLQISLADYEALGNAGGRTRAHHIMGTLEVALGDYVAAERHFQASLELAHATANPWDIGSSLFNLGELRRITGAPAEAETLLQQSLRLWTEIDDRCAVASALNGLGLVRADLADYAQALNYCRRSLLLFETLNDTLGRAQAHIAMGRVLMLSEQTEAALQSLGAGLRVALEHELLPTALQALLQLGLMWRDDQPAKTAMILNVLLQHPACEQHIRLSAERLRAQITPHVPSAPALTLDQVVATLLQIRTEAARSLP